MYVLPNPLFPFICFRVAMPQYHESIEAISARLRTSGVAFDGVIKNTSSVNKYLK